MNKVLVTGATGFIGKHTVQSLLRRDVHVIASSRTIEKNGLFNNTRITIKPYDLHQRANSTNLFDYFERPDGIIHLAWEGLPNYKEAFHLEKNLPAHQRFLSTLIRQGARDITVSGTCFEYGMQEGMLSETMEAKPQNAYAGAKDALRQWLETLQRQKSFTFKWARLFYMYGRGQNPKSLIAQLDRALETQVPVFNMSGGEQTRDFMPVEEVADCLVKIALQQRVTGIINIASNRPVTVKQFVSDYIRSKNKEMKLNTGYYPYPDFEPMHFWGDDRKLKSITE